MANLTSTAAHNDFIAFQEQFCQEDHRYLYLLYHAALPIALTTDLLYKIWFNFRFDQYQERLDIPFEAVADLLNAPVCRRLGADLYEIDPNLRTYLLSELQTNPKFGKARVKQLAQFLQLYIEKNPTKIPNPVFKKAQEWVALSYLQPQQLAKNIDEIFQGLTNNQENAMVKIDFFLNTVQQRNALANTSTAGNALADELAVRGAFAQGLRAFFKGDEEASIKQFEAIKDLLSFPTVDTMGLKTAIPQAVLERLALQPKQEEETIEADAEWIEGTNYLLVIGIDQYDFSSRLHNAVRDARTFANVLIEKYRFKLENTLLLLDQNATRSNIFTAFEELNRRMQEQDNLVFYFSGLSTYNSKIEEGYWVPFDGSSQDMFMNISNPEVINLLHISKARHIFGVVNASFDGSSFKLSSRTSPNTDTKRLYHLPSRWLLTSRQMEEVVMDGRPGEGSPFNIVLLECLKQNEGILPVSELCSLVIEQVTSIAKQTPSGGPLTGRGHFGGEFAFIHKDFNLNPYPTRDDERDIHSSIANESPKQESLPESLLQALERSETLAETSLTAAIDNLVNAIDRFSVESNIAEKINDLHQQLQAINKEQLAEKESNIRLTALRVQFTALIIQIKAEALRKGEARAEYLELIEQAEEYQNNQQFELAIEQYQKALEIDPNSVEVLAHLGDIELSIDHPARAILHYAQALNLNPEDASLTLKMGQAHQANEELEQARTYYHRALELNPRFAGAHFELALLEDEVNNTEQAMEHYRLAAEYFKDPSSRSHALHQLGIIELNLSRFEEAKEHLLDAYRIFGQARAPEEMANVTASLGLLHLKINQLEEANRWYQEARTIYNELGSLDREVAIMIDLGTVQLFAGNLAEAESYYQEAKTLNQEIPNTGLSGLILENLADLETQKGNLEQAKEHYEAALNIYESESAFLEKQAYINKALGDLSFHTGDYNEAITKLYRSLEQYTTLELPPEQAVVYLSLGEVALATDNLKDTIELCRNARKIFQSTNDQVGWADSLILRGRVALHQEAYNDAISYFEDAQRRYRTVNDDLGQGNAYYNLGMAHQGNRNFEAAKQYFLQARNLYLNVDAERAVANMNELLSDTEMELGNRKMAQEYLENAIETYRKFEAFELKDAEDKLKQMTSSSWRNFFKNPLGQRQQSSTSSSETSDPNDVQRRSDEIKDLMSKGEITLAIKLLMDFVIDFSEDEQLDESKAVIAINAEYRALIEREQKGILSSEEISQSRNKIVFKALELLRRIESSRG